MNEESLVRALQELMNATLRVEAKLDAVLIAGGIPVADMIDGAPDPATRNPIRYVADFESRLVVRKGGITHGKQAPMIGISSIIDTGGTGHGQDHSLRRRPERGGDESAEAE